MDETRDTWREVEKQTAQGFTRAKYITEEQKEIYLDQIREGHKPYIAARTAGSSHTQFARRAKQEPEFSKRVDEALEEGRPMYESRLAATIDEEAFEKGNYKAQRDLALIYLKEWLVLRNQRLDVAVGNMNGEALKLAAVEQLSAILPSEDVDQMIAMIERGMGELPPAVEE